MPEDAVGELYSASWSKRRARTLAVYRSPRTIARRCCFVLSIPVALTLLRRAGAGGRVDNGRLIQAGHDRISTPPMSCWMVWIAENGRSGARRLRRKPVIIFGAQSMK
jgi:hypothetical protein